MLISFAKRLFNPEHIVSISEPFTDSSKGRANQVIELETTRREIREVYDSAEAATARHEELVEQLEKATRKLIYLPEGINDLLAIPDPTTPGNDK